MKLEKRKVYVRFDAGKHGPSQRGGKCFLGVVGCVRWGSTMEPLQIAI